MKKPPAICKLLPAGQTGKNLLAYLYNKSDEPFGTIHGAEITGIPSLDAELICVGHDGRGSEMRHIVISHPIGVNTNEDEERLKKWLVIGLSGMRQTALGWESSTMTEITYIAIWRFKM